MRVMLTGSSGLWGSEILRQTPSEWELTAILHRNLELPVSNYRLAFKSVDICDRTQVDHAVRMIRPEVIIHIASIGNLDACESDPETAWKVNVEGTRHLLECSRELNCAFIFASSLYVFDGRNPPYDEEALPNPINGYARTKYEAEKLVQQIAARPVILRPMNMYGWHSPDQRMNWVTWLLSKLRKGEPVKVVTDVYNNNLWVGDAARAVVEVVKRGVTGVFHIGGPELASRWDFSVKIAEVFGLDRNLLTPVTSDHFPNIASRPPNAFCAIEKMRQILGVEPLNLQQGLEMMKTAEPQVNRQAASTSPYANSISQPARVMQ